MLKVFFCVACVLLSTAHNAAVAQQTVWRFGGGVQAGIALHNAAFKALPGIPMPSEAEAFTGAVNASIGLGGYAEWQAFPLLALGLQVDAQRTSAQLTASEGPLPYLMDNGSVGNITLQHTIDYSLLSLGVRPAVVVPLQPFTVLLGARFAVPVWSSFSQTEEISDASPGLEYLIGGVSRVRQSSAKLPSAVSLAAALEFGVAFDIPLNTSLVMRPELSYRHALTDVAAGTAWRAHSLHAGVSIYRPIYREHDVRIDTLYRRDTTVQVVAGLAAETLSLAGQTVQISDVDSGDYTVRTVVISEQYVRAVPKPAPLLTAGLDVRFVLNNGQETEGVRVSVETVLEKNVVPVLPYVFFDDMSASIPARYAQTFAPVSAVVAGQLDRRDVLGIYRNLLNIVGQRLAQKTTATIVLTGTNSGEGEERKNTALSQQRAESIRQYLVHSWGIAPERIAVRAVNLPLRPSNTALPGGSEENRRVELSSDDPSILAPLVLQDTVRIANPPIIRFYPDILSEAGIADWQISVSQSERFYKVFADSSEPPEYIDWNISQDKAALVSADAPMQYVMRVRDRANAHTETGQGTIVFQVQQQNGTVAGRSEVTRYSLIVFDYDGADVTQMHKTSLASIRESLPLHAQITVMGMTDELGNAEYNRQLSERRAKAIAAALQLPTSVAQGMGEQTELSSETPEGRFYSRRVDILVKKSSTP